MECLLLLLGAQHLFGVENSRKTLYFRYSSALIPQLIDAGLIPKNPIQGLELTPVFTSLFHQLNDLMPNAQELGCADRIDMACFQFMEELLISRKKIGKVDNVYRDKIMKISSYLQLYCNQNIDFDVLARVYGLSRRSFFRHWAQHFDISPTNFIQKARITEAKRLLKDTHQ
jgi:AraC-like DNA-binding protein